MNELITQLITAMREANGRAIKRVTIHKLRFEHNIDNHPEAGDYNRASGSIKKLDVIFEENEGD